MSKQFTSAEVQSSMERCVVAEHREMLRAFDALLAEREAAQPVAWRISARYGSTVTFIKPADACIKAIKESCGEFGSSFYCDPLYAYPPAPVEAGYLCEDEGCPHYGIKHVCIDKPAPKAEPSVPDGWREVLQGMRDNVEVYGPYSKEVADAVLYDVMNALDDLESVDPAQENKP